MVRAAGGRSVPGAEMLPCPQGHGDAVTGDTVVGDVMSPPAQLWDPQHGVQGVGTHRGWGLWGGPWRVAWQGTAPVAAVAPVAVVAVGTPAPAAGADPASAARGERGRGDGAGGLWLRAGPGREGGGEGGGVEGGWDLQTGGGTGGWTDGWMGGSMDGWMGR